MSFSYEIQLRLPVLYMGMAYCWGLEHLPVPASNSFTLGRGLRSPPSPMLELLTCLILKLEFFKIQIILYHERILFESSFENFESCTFGSCKRGPC